MADRSKIKVGDRLVFAGTVREVGSEDRNYLVGFDRGDGEGVKGSCPCADHVDQRRMYWRTVTKAKWHAQRRAT